MNRYTAALTISDFCRNIKNSILGNRREAYRIPGKDWCSSACGQIPFVNSTGIIVSNFKQQRLPCTYRIMNCLRSRNWRKGIEVNGSAGVIAFVFIGTEQGV